MTPDDPRHGTTAGWSKHRNDHEKPCDPCRIAWNAYRLRYCKERDLGYVRQVPIDHGGAWQRIDDMRQAGNTYPAIAQALGLGESHVYRIHARVFKTVSVRTWRRIMARDIDLSALKQPTHIGTVRRARALHAIGWPGYDIAKRAGLSKETMKKLLRGQLQQTQHATRAAITAVYEELWDQSPPRTKHTVRAEKRSEREGWGKPMSWVDIDDPSETHTRQRSAPRGPDEYDESVVLRILAGEWKLRATNAERREVVRRWDRPDPMGGSKANDPTAPSLAYLGRLTGWKVERYAPRREPAA
jgi:hypothetical protein